ncbi:MAG: hypothetical protein AB8F65_11050 [Woeseiaceae bacterium]
MRKATFYPMLTILFLSLLPYPNTAHASDADELKTMQSFIELMRGYYAIIEVTHSISSDPEQAAIMQLQKIKEVMDETGQRSRAAEIFRDVLSRTENRAIRNAASLLLSETLKESGDSKKAITVLLDSLEENLEATR